MIYQVTIRLYSLQNNDSPELKFEPKLINEIDRRWWALKLKYILFNRVKTRKKVIIVHLEPYVYKHSNDNKWKINFSLQKKIKISIRFVFCCLFIIVFVIFSRSL